MGERMLLMPEEHRLHVCGALRWPAQVESAKSEGTPTLMA